MSIEETQRVLDGYLDALFNEGDFAAFFAEDVLWTTMETGDQIRGRESVAEFIVAFHSKMFDATPEVKKRVAADGVALVELDFVGTHIGDFGGIAPTGVGFRVPYCVVYDIPGSSITALRAYFPIAVLVQRLSEGDPASGEPAAE